MWNAHRDCPNWSEQAEHHVAGSLGRASAGARGLAWVAAGRSVRYSNSVSVEKVDEPVLLHNPGRIAARVARQVELGLATVDLSVSQYRILGALSEGSDLSSHLAERLAVRPPSVTAVIDGLVSRGLVARTHSEDDRRRISLQLTEGGQQLLLAADRAMRERLEQIASTLAPKAAARALESLELWHDALEANRASKSRS